MKQGTISILVGCHSPIHWYYVIKSWKILYGKYPKFWEFICICLHDIGHIGLNYLDDIEEKRKHYKLGARIARFLFGKKGYDLCAGHCNHSGHPISDLYKADKYSWYIAPRWWLISNTFFEPKLKMGYTAKEAVDKFKESVKMSVESGEYRSSHQMFLDRCNNIQ